MNHTTSHNPTKSGRPHALRGEPGHLGSRFTVALVLFAAVYLVGETLPDETWSALLMWPLTAAATLVIFNATAVHHAVRRGFLALALVTFGLAVAALASDRAALATPGSELPVLCVPVVLVLILRHVFRRQRVTLDLVFGALTAYLLIGLLFALLYTVIARADPTLFVPVQDLDERNGLFYFSFVTLTTIGYGDITPAADWVRSIAVLEGLTGQIFLVVLVARLVGMEIAQRANESLQDPAARPEQ